MSKCPHDPKVVCSYLEQKDPVTYSCSECVHYKQTVDNDPVGGRSLLGCLFVGAVIVAGFLVAVGWLIHNLRP